MALVVKGDFGSDAYTRMRVWWREGFEQAPEPEWSQVATRFDSDTETEVYAFLGEVPSMQEYKDERVIRALVANSWSLTNKKWESTIGIDRAAVDRNQLNHIRPRIQNLGYEGRRYVDRLVLGDLMNNLRTGSFTSIDGVYTCSNSHYWPGSEASTGSLYVNVITGTTHPSSVDLSVLQSDLSNAESQLAGFLDDQGNALNTEPWTHIVCPAAMATPFRRLLNATDVNVNGVTQSNIYRGTFSLLVDARLSNSNDWYVVRAGGLVNPLVFQEEIATEFVALDNPSQDYEAFMRDRYLYGNYARSNVGAPVWWRIVMVRSGGNA